MKCHKKIKAFVHKKDESSRYHLCSRPKRTDTLPVCNGTSRFHLRKHPNRTPFGKTTPKLPSTSFLSKGLSATEPFSLRISDVYSSFSLSFTVFIHFLYHQILFNFASFVKSKLCNCSCIHTKGTFENLSRKSLHILM